MKPRLLLYLTTERNPVRNAIAATLSWACEEAGWFFEAYHDGYRLGEHYGGGDPNTLPPGYAAGGTMVGAHHHERLYLLLHRFDTTVLLDGPVAFGPALDQLDVKRITPEPDATQADSSMRGNPLGLYRAAFELLGIAMPDTLALLDACPAPSLAGLDAYYYPNIVVRRALALEIGDIGSGLNGMFGTLATFLAEGGVRRVALLGLNAEHTAAARRHISAAAPEVAIESDGVIQVADTFDEITERIARQHLDAWGGGWILADPMTVSAWLPEAVRERRLAIYGRPQRRVIQRLATELSETHTAVLGRQYEDADFFELSSLGVAFQLVDPGRPPFPVLRHAGYQWSTGIECSARYRDTANRRPDEPDDEQLRRWAAEGRVLTSLIFWTGMIRELESLPRIVDLVALTRMKAGLALTTEALAYQPEAPLELLRVPLEQGGVFPHLEILLASCGVGAAIESRLPEGRLAAYFRDATLALDRLGLPPQVRPRGWWSTMDCEMRPLPHPRLPFALAPQRAAPFVKVRYAGATSTTTTSGGKPTSPASPGLSRAATSALGAPGPRRRGVQNAKRQLGDWARAHGLRELLAPYRPYEFFAPGPFDAATVAPLRAAGLTYMFSKAGFGAPPRVLYRDDAFVALNYTVGHWDGWTPFETINGLQDLRAAERRLLAGRQPGWLVGTLDACLWAFTGPIWTRGAELRAIGEYLAHGGASGKLINVTPEVVARYARMLSHEVQTGGADASPAVSLLSVS